MYPFIFFFQSACPRAKILFSSPMHAFEYACGIWCVCVCVCVFTVRSRQSALCACGVYAHPNGPRHTLKNIKFMADGLVRGTESSSLCVGVVLLHLLRTCVALDAAPCPHSRHHLLLASVWSVQVTHALFLSMFLGAGMALNIRITNILPC